ncbi:MAG: hypothetical protein NUV84_03030, partial [Candidatus Uhrbacteria bacterium]|nr:hypothetical protein [Candidatus Uhrbacteria bacterium]
NGSEKYTYLRELLNLMAFSPALARGILALSNNAEDTVLTAAKKNAEWTLAIEADREQIVTERFSEYTFSLLAGHGHLAHELRPDVFRDRLQTSILKKKRSVGDRNEIIWHIPSVGSQNGIVIKALALSKIPDRTWELRVLQRIEKAGLPGPRPIGMLDFPDGEGFLIMTFLEGRPLTQEERERDEMKTILKSQADLYRSTVWIDKPWAVKDVLLQEKDGRHEIVQIDWERSRPFDPNKPIETLDIFGTHPI